MCVVVLPSFAPLPTPSAFTAAATSLRWRLRSVALAARSRLLALLRSPHSFGSRIPKSPVRAAARQAPLVCGAVCHGSAISPRHTPTSSETKKGRRFRLPSGCYSYASNPATTASSVLESNALAASVTGR